MKKKKDRSKSFILWFDEIGIEDIPLVGGKNASLGEMRKNTNIKIPPGFAITSYAYRYILEKAGILNKLKDERGQACRSAKRNADLQAGSQSNLTFLFLFDSFWLRA